ncbi:MAG: response regulator [Planctomycetia bacterium]|nr:response regulator [Planctomycetia bacterium]
MPALDACHSQTEPAIARGAAAAAGPRREKNIKQARILIVDDETLTSDVVQGYLEMEGYRNIRSTGHAIHALPLIGEFSPDLVLLDIHMPEMNGLEILKAIRADRSISTIPVVILTASSTNDTKLEALHCGATDLLSKPVHQGELLARIRNVLAVKEYQDRLCRHSEELEEAVLKRTADLEASRLELIHCLARAAEFRDDDTGRHIIRVGRYARIIGEQLGMSKAQLDVLEPAAQLHDVGKIGISDAILLKPGRLTPEEYECMQRHCGFGKKIIDCLPAREAELVRRHAELGAKIMDVGRSPILQMAMRIALTHHERWDGTGYPLGLAGEDIPLEGRITAVADVFDALSSKRSYKPAFPLEKCFQILDEGRGSQFDRAMIDAFTARRSEIVRTQIELADTD